MIAPVQGRVGQTVTLEGYADDFGNQIDAIEVSLDGGRSWASFSTAESNAESIDPLDLLLYPGAGRDATR